MKTLSIFLALAASTLCSCRKCVTCTETITTVSSTAPPSSYSNNYDFCGTSREIKDEETSYSSTYDDGFGNVQVQTTTVTCN